MKTQNKFHVDPSGGNCRQGVRQGVRQTDMMKVMEAITNNIYVKLFAVSRALKMGGHDLLSCRRMNCEGIGRVLIPVLEVTYSNSSNRCKFRKIVQNMRE
jgi:hypothetical protein